MLDHFRSLHADATVAEVVRACRSAGVEDPLLLKGPALAQLLYPEDPLRRTYVDADLLVGPGQFAATCQLLRSLGFVDLSIEVARGERRPHADTWMRTEDGAVVDLHRSIHGLEGAPLDDLWQAACSEGRWLEVAGESVRCTGPVLLALQAVTHVAYVNNPTAKAEEDLTRAVEHLDAEVWRAAASLAGRLGSPELMASLHSHPQGCVIATALDLPRSVSWAARAVAGEDVPGFVTVNRFLELPGAGAKRAYLRDKLFPPTSLLRQSSALARRGSTGLVLAYGLRIPVCLWRIVRGASTRFSLRRAHSDR